MHFEGEEADGLLAAWTALWHPALLAATETAPNWHHAGSPPEDVSGLLILVPGASLSEVPAGFLQRAEEQGATVITGNRPRHEILDQVLRPVAKLTETLDPELTADFLALGYGYLQVELLTRQMRYATNLDEIHFHNQAIAGAVAAVGGEAREAHDKLVACFDLLAQERDHYYAVDAYVIDLVLLAPTTLGLSLERLVGAEVPVNLLVTAEIMTQLQLEAPDTFEAVSRGLTEGYVSLVGGDDRESRTPLLSCETVLRQLREGIHRIKQLTQSRPIVFGRRRFGVAPIHPQLLRYLGYIGALHATLDGGKSAEGSQLKIRWEGTDLTTIDTIARAPLDAAQAGTFLSYASKLSETMDMDHIATICFAHWPGQVSPWYDDLRRVARYGGLLGKFVTLDDYFRDSEYPTQLERFQADHYRSPYLVQSVRRNEPDAISTSVRYWRRRARVDAAQALATIVAVVDGKTDSSLAAVDELSGRVDRAAEQADVSELDERVNAALTQMVTRFAERVPRTQDDERPGYLVVNPSSTVRRVGLDLPALEGLPAIEKPVYAAAADGDHRYVVVDVPPMGFAWVGGNEATQTPKRPAQPLAESYRLRNEFFEAHVNPTTGALRGIYQYDVRGNRLSQQLALRMPMADARGQSGKRALYSVMAADRVEVTAMTSAMAEITAEGRLLSRQGKTLATYRQRYQIWRGSRVLRLYVDLDPRVQPSEDPWNSYYACRFAWASEAAGLWRGMNQLRERAEAKRLEAPTYLEIDDGARRTTLLTGGLPYHRRTGLRMLDTLLIVRGERARSFELGIGIDVKYPIQEAMALLAPSPAVYQVAATPATGVSSWLFHLDCRNVVATHWAPLVTDGRVQGVRVRLLETLGRPAHAKLRGFRPFNAARQLDFVGDSQGSCAVRDGAARVELSANEWVEIEATW